MTINRTAMMTLITNKLESYSSYTMYVDTKLQDDIYYHSDVNETPVIILLTIQSFKINDFAFNSQKVSTTYCTIDKSRHVVFINKNAKRTETHKKISLQKGALSHIAYHIFEPNKNTCNKMFQIKELNKSI